MKNSLQMTEIRTYNLSPFDVSNWFICTIDREVGDSITHLKLQKLLYYAQAWSLVLNEKGLFAADFEAWAHGPIIPSVYERYKEHGFEALPPCECENDIVGDSEEVLKEVKRIYGELSAKKLEQITHSEPPWIESRDGLEPEARCSTIIPKARMQSYYTQLLHEAEKEYPREEIKNTYLG